MESCKYAGGFASLCRALMDKEWPEIYVNLLDTMAVGTLSDASLSCCWGIKIKSMKVAFSPADWLSASALMQQGCL